jgi:membrane protease YdiL (CAAX protease family)
LLAGAWGWFALMGAMFVFNTVLGEELLFRGFLLPRMNGVFGRRDWVANGMLFAAYHVHVPWVIPVTLLDTFIVAGPSKRYRSALVGIAVHSAQSVVFFALVLSLVLKG